MASGYPPPPADAELEALLDRQAPLAPTPLVPEVLTFQGRDLVEVWQAADRVAGVPVPSPFWAYPWPGGSALARYLLDRPELVRGRAVLDVGCGGGVAALAAARTGAGRVVADDVDPWALATTRIAAARQALRVELSGVDLAAAGWSAAMSAAYDVVLCGDVSYERDVAPLVRALLSGASRAGLLVLASDPGRAWFSDEGLEELAAYRVEVPSDLEGTRERRPRVFRVRS